MTFYELLKDLFTAELKRILAARRENLGRIDFYKPTTLGKAPSTPK